jgi:hypothetical protein
MDKRIWGFGAAGALALMLAVAAVTAGLMEQPA